MNKDELYFKRANEYFEMITKLNRNIARYDNIEFLDGKSMYNWYNRETSRLFDERKRNIIPSKKRIEEIILFSKIEDKLYEIKKNNYERRVNEYINEITKLGRNLNKNDNILFSDKTNMYDWYHCESGKYNAEKRNNITPSKSRKEEILLFTEIKSKLIELKKNRTPKSKKRKILEEVKLAKYEKRCNEYIDEIIKLGRTVRKGEDIRFTDGARKYNWYSSELSKLYFERKNNITLDNYRIEEIKLFAKIEDKLEEIKLTKYEEKCNEYINEVIKLGRNLNKNDNILFSDKTNMYDWYHYESGKFNEERRNNVTPSKSRKEEMVLFARIDDKLIELKSSKALKLKKRKILEEIKLAKYEKRCNEYIDEITKLGRNIKYNENSKFTDGVKKYNWYSSELSKLYFERKNNITLDNYRIEEIKLFAKIENKLVEFKPKKSKTYKDNALEKYEKRCNEYINEITKLGRNIKYSEDIKFTDGISMHDWYFTELCKVNKLNCENNPLSKMQEEKIKLFTEVKEKVNELKIKTYEKKCNEYIKEITKLGRNLNKDDNIFFTDGTNMYNWYCKESFTLSKERKSNVIIDSYRMGKIMLFSNIDNKLEDYRKEKYKNGHETNYEIRCIEYIELIKDLGRNLNTYDDEVFSDGVNMYNWYVHEEKKLRKERKEDIVISNKRMNDIILFSKIDDILRELKWQKYKTRCTEYINLVKKIGRNLNKEDEEFFTDGANMCNWYQNNLKKIDKERKENLMINKERMREIMLFAYVCDEIYNLKQTKKLELNK